MDWLGCANRMDQFVIKKDGTAVDIEYFMATHVPFRNLEFSEFGDTQSNIVQLNENQIYEKYIVNKANKHQMIIVKGTNGTGKSHFICWLYNRFVNDKDNYDPKKEKVIFLRRLGNTVRGAVQQMLDEGLVKDNELQNKFIKFCSAEKSQSEEEFKVSIYNEYVKRVQTDVTNTTYKQVVCKNIAAFMFDSRVQEYMLRPEGPVDKCYQMITSGAKTIVTDETETIFSIKDLDFPKEVAKAIKKESAEEVKSFYLYEIRSDEGAIQKLIKYLNHFTSGVIQSCANITSENARDLFVNLRKSLYKEGKNLTIFIEDFTSFSIVESELITALSVENGGKYSDLCRVTSVIGITDGYYDSFRDNFKDRVTKQVRVTEQSYGGKEFILEMAARYLNAIYCDELSVRNWYKGSSITETLPVSNFSPSMKWDSISIGNNDYTLYPFNENSIVQLYEMLKHKSPRNFLTHVIQHFFAQFADGMQYGDNWRFPELPVYITPVTLEPPYADNVESSNLSLEDKQRLKVLLSIWGDKTTKAKENEIGGLNKKYLNDISLGSFIGFSSVNTKPGPGGGTEIDVKQPQLTTKQLTFKRKKEDIESWFESKKTLEYSSDFKKWVTNFVLQGIAWQDEGLPAEYITQRWKNGGFVSIEDAKLAVNEKKAVVTLERTSEARTILTGLNLFDYYNNWEFENAAYYQLVLVNWLEKNKKQFIKKIYGDAVGTVEHPVITWCLAIEYIKRVLLGQKLDDKNDDELLKILIKEPTPIMHNSRINKDWEDVINYISGEQAKYEQIKMGLYSGSNTFMGIIGESSESKVDFFRTSELKNSLKHLRNKNWNISDELSDFEGTTFENERITLKKLYTKASILVDNEKKLASEKINEFEKLVGKKPNESKYQEIVLQIQELFKTCNAAHEMYVTELKIKFDGTPDEQAKAALGAYLTLKATLNEGNVIEMLERFSQCPIEKLESIINDLKNVEICAKNLYDKHSSNVEEGEKIDQLIVDGILEKLEALSDKITEVEVENDT
ncbi:MAG: hypothetical protein K6F97_04570 [Lachnospiraceae bacterium]|nr:hypothetical protein [Lachnospiraceae bacterium]